MKERRTKSNGRSSAIGRNGTAEVREGRAEEAVLIVGTSVERTGMPG